MWACVFHDENEQLSADGQHLMSYEDVIELKTLGTSYSLGALYAEIV
jgi:hypothetical protein